jgi:hypothetical protein
MFRLMCHSQLAQTFSVNPQQISAPFSNGGSSAMALNSTQQQEVPDHII